MSGMLPAGVSEMVELLLAGAQDILGERLTGIYLRGSLALGDFDLATSDIDFFAVTEQRITNDELTALAELHTWLDRLPSRFAAELEGPYIEREAARRFVPGQQYPTIGRGGPLTWHEHGANWILERWAVREHGITLYGPDPKTLIDLIERGEIVEAVCARLPDWAEWANDEDAPEWLVPRRRHNAYVVETMCRALNTLATGQLLSKRQAVAWALENLPNPWRAIVEQARTWHADDTIDHSIVPELRAFVLWVAAQAASPVDSW